MHSLITYTQAEEDAAAAALFSSRLHLRSSNKDQSTFKQQIKACINKVESYEDEIAQAMALSVIDLDGLQTRAHDAAFLSKMLDESPPLAFEDALAVELLLWFKQSFFHWVNNAPCSVCQSTKTFLEKTSDPSTDEEVCHQASRVECYICTACTACTRFPRYNDPIKLLETRQGRCGEWANCFALCCRAVGLDTRLVLDFTDHVWVEYYSTALCRWIHLDPCEAAVDTPLLYSLGWGKKLTYCIGISKDGVADVTQRYITQRCYNETLARRTMVSETWLQGYLRSVNERMRGSFEVERRNMLARRDEEDERAMHEACTMGAAEEAHWLPGRQTGSVEWIASRGEGGDGGGCGGIAATIHNNSTGATRYAWASDTHLSALDPGRLCGGAVRASADNPPLETAACAFDGRLDTKWLDFNGCKSNSSWLEYRVLPAMDAVALTRYALTSANDAEERDPKHVVMEAYDEEKNDWVILDERMDVRFSGRLSRVTFDVDEYGSGGDGKAEGSTDSIHKSNSVRYRRFRLRIVSVLDPGNANSVQLAKLDLYSDNKHV